jgi:hypothetical protein
MGSDPQFDGEPEMARLPQWWLGSPDSVLKHFFVVSFVVHDYEPLYIATNKPTRCKCHTVLSVHTHPLPSLPRFPDHTTSSKFQVPRPSKCPSAIAEKHRV